MNMLLVIILVLVLLGGYVPLGGPYIERGHFYGTGPFGGVLGLILVILLVLVLFGQI